MRNFIGFTKGEKFYRFYKGRERMIDSRVCPARWLPLLCTVTLLTFGPAHAQVPVTGYVVINPIDVCGSTGPTSATGCAPFNSAKTSPSQATSTTPIGFVDSSTNINLTRAIWLQAGIDVTFFPIVEFDNAGYQSIGDVTTTNNPLYSCLFWNLSTNGNTSILQPPAGVTPCVPASLPALKDSHCNTRHCTLPLATTKSNALNMFFVNTINNGALFGFGWLNNNGIAIGANVFLSSPPRFDTMAHELGHNLALDHCTYGAGDVYGMLTSTCPATSPAVACAGSSLTLSSPGGCNVMDTGTIRNVAASSGCTAASTTNNNSPTGGQLYNLYTGLYLSTPACAGTPPMNPISDFLIPSTQASQAQLTGFINPVPNVNATAGGGSGGAAPLAASTSSSPNKSITITIPNNGGGRETAGPTEFVNNIVFAFANGISPAGKNALQSSSGQPVVIAAFNVNGNNGQNPNCAKQAGLAPPGVHCYEVQYQAGTFIPGTTSTLVLNLTQNNQPLTDPQAIVGSQFTPLLETDQPLGTPIAFFATTGNFENTVNGVQASTQFPDPTTAAVVLNASGGPADTNTFTGTPNSVTGTISGCTPQCNDSGCGCPTPIGGDNHGQD
jgi:hypothetical protein